MWVPAHIPILWWGVGMLGYPTSAPNPDTGGLWPAPVWSLLSQRLQALSFSQGASTSSHQPQVCCRQSLSCGQSHAAGTTASPEVTCLVPSQPLAPCCLPALSTPTPICKAKHDSNQFISLTAFSGSDLIKADLYYISLSIIIIFLHFYFGLSIGTVTNFLDFSAFAYIHSVCMLIPLLLRVYLIHSNNCLLQVF